MDKINDDDWMLFTSVVLLVSSTSTIARDEIDELIKGRTNHDHHIVELKRARSGVALLAAIANHYEKEIADEQDR